MIKKIIVVIVIFIASVLVYVWDEMGQIPETELSKYYQKSPNYSASKHEFKNKFIDVFNNDINIPMSLELLGQWFFPEVETKPPHPLPFEKPNFKEIMESYPDKVQAIWFGHSSIFLRINGLNILIDPVFSDSVFPVPIFFKRFQPPIVELYDLPKIDIVLISHDHYDHLDKDTVRHFAGTSTSFIVPLGVESHLIYWGIESDKITNLDWWAATKVQGVEFIATPAQHFSGRNGIHQYKTLWASWVIRTNDKSVYFSGDTGFSTHFEDIGRQFGPFDVAFIETGQYNKAWQAVHLLPEESASAGYYLNTKVHFPIHWGMFDLSVHAWDEPIKLITRHCLKHKFELIEPYLGKVYTF